jgi:glycosyltransferase involved in cell wall biosynthesis
VIAGCEFLYHLLPELHREFPRTRVIDQLFNDTGHIVNNRRYANLIDLNIVPSRLLADTLIQKHGAEPERVVAIQNGANIDVTVYGSRAEAFAASGLPPDSAGKFLVSFLGRLSEEKAPCAFVEIARRLASRRDIFFCIAGDGPERAAVLNAIASHGLQDNVFYAGLLRDVRPLLAASDVVVVPSTLDGMPQIVVEAQLFAKPVIASAVGSLPDMIDEGVTGYLCPAGDVEAFRARIEALHASPDLRSRMGDRARKAAVARYDLGKMVNAYVEAFEFSGPIVRQNAAEG